MDSTKKCAKFKSMFVSLDFSPSIVRWIYSSGSTVMSIAVAEAKGHKIRIFDSTSSTAEPSRILDQIHHATSTVTAVCFSPALKVGVRYSWFASF